MVILGIKLHNILCFNDFSMNFSYKKKLTNTLIKDEFIKDFPTFRYKKLNVFIGSNSSGKTCLVTSIWKTMLFLSKKTDSYIKSIVDDSHKESLIQMDLVDTNKEISTLYRIIIKTMNGEKMTTEVAYHSIVLDNTTSYENSLNELDSHDYEYKDYVMALNELNLDIGWNVVLPATEEMFGDVSFAELESEEERKDYLNILNAVFKTLDPSISSITESNDSKDAYVIRQNAYNRTIIVQKDMKIYSIPYLSSGTKYGFNIAKMIFSIKHNLNGIYFIDEQFCYVNSEIECAILSLIVSLIGNDEQIFYMTHNANVLDLGFPFHSFNFLKKTFINDHPVISVNCATEVENRNNVSPKTIVDNDMLATAPELGKIFAINEE